MERRRDRVLRSSSAASIRMHSITSGHSWRTGRRRFRIRKWAAALIACVGLGRTREGIVCLWSVESEPITTPSTYGAM